MFLNKKTRKKSVYSYKRYWYHVSTTLKNNKEYLIPWGEQEGFNRSGDEPDGNRICVAPTIEQCITAIPYVPYCTLRIYRTENKVKATKPVDVFDSKITKEGWLLEPTTFIQIGKLYLEEIAWKLNIDEVIDESASSASLQESAKVLKWWKRIRIRRFIKRT